MTLTLLIISSLIGASALYPYIRDLIRGRVRPRLVSWSVWTILAGVMTISALLNGHFASAALSAQGLFGCGAVVLFGWKRGSRQIGRIDIISLIGAAIGLLSLIFLHDPNLALLMSVAIDAVAYMPTLVHAWTDPDEESLACYVLDVAAASLALVAALHNGWNFIGVIYPLYSVTFNGLMAGLLITSKAVFEADYDYENSEI